MDTRLARNRAFEWLARYGPAEVGATVGAVLAVSMAVPFGPVASAYAGAIGDGVGFYGVMLGRDLRRRPRGLRLRAVPTVLRGLAVECGPAEVVDTLATRPLAMYLATGLLGTAFAGAVTGKIAADIAFYAMAIVAYEWRRQRASRRCAH